MDHIQKVQQVREELYKKLGLGRESQLEAGSPSVRTLQQRRISRILSDAGLDLGTIVDGLHKDYSKKKNGLAHQCRMSGDVIAFRGPLRVHHLLSTLGAILRPQPPSADRTSQTPVPPV